MAMGADAVGDNIKLALFLWYFGLSSSTSTSGCQANASGAGTGFLPLILYFFILYMHVLLCVSETMHDKTNFWNYFHF